MSTDDKKRRDDARADETLSGAYALGALEQADAAAFEKLLAESEDLRTEVAGFTDTAAVLAGATEPVMPPARVKADLFAMLDSVEQLPALPEAAAERRETVAPQSNRVEAEAEMPLAPVTDLTRHTPTGRSKWRERSRRARLSTVVVAAAAACVLFAGGIAIGGAITGQSDSQVDQFAALSAAPDMQRVVTELPRGGKAALISSAELGMSAVVLDGAPALEANKTYQAWYVREDGPHSAGLVEPLEHTTYRMLDGEYSEGDVVALTLEPAGGSAKPTTDAIVLASTSAVRNDESPATTELAFDITGLFARSLDEV